MRGAAMTGVNRRDFIKTGAAGLAAATVASVAPPTSASETTNYPAIDVVALGAVHTPSNDGCLRAAEHAP